MHFKKTCLFLFFLIYGLSGPNNFLAQSNEFQLYIIRNDSITLSTKEKKENRSVYGYFSNIGLCIQEAKLFIRKIQEEGYLASRIDSIQTIDKQTKVFYTKGEAYKWVKIGKGNAEEGALSQIGYRERVLRKMRTDYKTINKLLEKLIAYYENQGYPFASAHLDSLKLDSLREFSGSLSVKRNKLIHLDSLLIKGEGKFPVKYLENYLNIKPGMPYKEEVIAKASNRLKELPFISVIKSPEVLFMKDYTKLYIYLATKKASHFDAIAGISPDAQGKVLVSGDVKLNLMNAFKKGELLDINWKNPQVQTQDLKIRMVYPFLFNTPFGTDIQFSLYKKDSTYIDIIINTGIQYLLSGGNFLKVFVLNKESFLINKKGLENLSTLPAFADISSRLYGIGYKMEDLDYKINPRKGFSILLDVAAGNKQIHKNEKIKESLYEGIQLNSTQLRAEYTVDFYLPLSNRNVTNIGLMGGHFGGGNLFKNELFRIGGLKTLRGFNEESIWASSYTIFKWEQRFIMEKNAYIFVFFNAAYYENHSQGERTKDLPYGYGPGINFETKLGIFSFNYGLGKEFKNPVYLRSGKIHFGFLSYF